MTLKTTSAYITTVGPDHTIVLPDNIAVGATVAVVLMSSQTEASAQPDRSTASSLYGILSHLEGTIAPTETLDETRRELWSAWDRGESS